MSDQDQRICKALNDLAALALAAGEAIARGESKDCIGGDFCGFFMLADFVVQPPSGIQ